MTHRFATAPADKPLSNRVISREDIATVDDGFRGLLAAGSVFMRYGQHLEALHCYRAALDIASRRWWLNTGGRPDSHFLDASEIRTRIRAAALIPRSQYQRLKRTIKSRSPRVPKHAVQEVRQVAMEFWRKAITRNQVDEPLG